MIKIQELTKAFGSNVVLKNLNLTIPDGTIFGLVGINGAGKSTLLRLLAGVYQVDQGSITYDDHPIYDEEDVKKNIFFLPEDPYYSVNTTGDKLLALYKTFYEVDEASFYQMIHQFKLDPTLPLRKFSKGMRRQMFIALAMACKPKVLLLDEAFDGLDPLARLAFKRNLITLSEENKTSVVISSHSLRELEDICDSYGLIDHQTISSSGEIATEIEKVHKIQVAFSEEHTASDFKNLEILHFEATGRIIRLVIRGSLEDIKSEINTMNPLLIDEIPIDFEELFMVEVESKGYLQ